MGETVSDANPPRVRESFEQLVQAEAVALTRHVRLVYPGVDVEEVVSETFAVAWRRYDELPQDALRSWLRGTARRVVANDQRGQRRWRALNERVNRLTPDSPVLGPDDPASLDLLVVSKAMDRLSDADRDVLLMCALEDLSTDDLAVVLDVRPAAAKKRLSRARERLRVAVAELEEGTRP